MLFNFSSKLSISSFLLFTSASRFFICFYNFPSSMFNSFKNYVKFSISLSFSFNFCYISSSGFFNFFFKLSISSFLCFTTPSDSFTFSFRSFIISSFLLWCASYFYSAKTILDYFILAYRFTIVSSFAKLRCFKSSKSSFNLTNFCSLSSS